MAYEQLREQLKQNVAEFLFELASKREYPIHPFVGLWGFKEGVSSGGVNVHLDKEKKEARFEIILPVGERNYTVSTSMSYGAIIAGSGSIPGSPNAYEESTFDLLTQARFRLDKQHKIRISSTQEKALSEFLAKQKEGYFTAMQSVWKDFFGQFHENVLVAVDGTIPRLERSALMDSVLTDGELESYFGACADEDIDDREDFEMYFNDKFLQELKLIKGYCILAPDPKKIDYSPLDCLMHGSQMHWRNLEKLVV